MGPISSVSLATAGLAVRLRVAPQIHLVRMEKAFDTQLAATLWVALVADTQSNARWFVEPEHQHADVEQLLDALARKVINYYTPAQEAIDGPQQDRTCT